MNRKKFLLLSAITAVTFVSGIAHAAPSKAPSQADDEFRILNVAPYSGNLKSTGTWIRDALKAYATDMQKAGFTRKIVIKEVDDEYKPDKTLSIATEQAKEFKPHAMFGLVGTANLKILVDKKFFDGNEFPLIGARSGAPIYHPKVVHLRASYAAEVMKLMEFASISGFDRVGVVYQGDAFGKDGLQAAQTYAASHKEVTLVADAPYTPNTTEVDPALKLMLASNLKAIIIVGNTNATAAVTSKVKKSGQKIALYTVSAVDPGQVVDKIKDDAQGLVVSQVVPGLYDARFGLSADFRKFAQRHNLPPNSTVYEGYLWAKTLFDAASHVKGPMSGTALLHELRAKPLNYGGFRLNMPDQQRPSSFIDTMIIGSKNEQYY